MVQEEWTKLAKRIYQYCGIDFINQEATLTAKLTSRLQELGLTIHEYLLYLNSNPAEWDKLIEHITINETYFFREEKALEAFSAILQEYQYRKDTEVLRIWSAACSSGEEPYTLAMLIKESGLFPRGSVQIVASDIDSKILEKAQRGRYGKKSLSFRKMPEVMLRKYFFATGEDYQINDELKEMITFRKLNLLEPYLVGKMEKVDIIFCRNVLIYFDGPVIQKIIHRFADIIKPGGYLFLGHAETIHGTKSPFETIYQYSAFYYRKGGTPS
ncbi:protein-glutamate O-methyltransferase CheR [Heliorestis acidaminivorans]|uniref:protein-glutamate O-methyltransferase n=1 Tax=Heliorestis acidaminivorans TaxID=553427 RepID=A0A6I0ESU3_9FIRM|nr:protein-glutamate O-methyltransferase CheR [Heliorestis acidaminivorans]KAB2952968.1 protein-glutamate O-methyltransferase CheR [Heliorestis acidaminivorans]